MSLDVMGITEGGCIVGRYDSTEKTIRPTRGVAQGWECPNCHTVWAPHVTNCRCSTQKSYKKELEELDKRVK